MIAFNDLARASAALAPQLDSAMARVRASGWYVLGEEGRAFEAELATALGTEHAAGCGSGTDAIELALRALGVGPGDEVITQANTCVPTVAAIARAGATAVLCNVEPAAGTMDPGSARAALSERTKAIVPVHLYGQCADVDAIADLGVPVVEDCAQAQGATLRGRPAGTMGALGCFSFYPTKNLGALGDGGAVITADAALDERVRLVRQYGQTERYRHEHEGVNSRLDELQAAILRVKLPHVEAWVARRNAIAQRYDAVLGGAALARLPDRRHGFHLYVIEVSDRDGFQDQMRNRGVATLVHYPVPIHRHPPYAELRRTDLSVAEALADRIVSLPLYPELTDDEVETVASAAAEALRAVAA